tara:strand:- start:176 stop:1213 length:1038 start_codon:yes stop_codon:yes gene_type:complete
MCGALDPDADDGIYYKSIDTVYAGAYIGSGESSVTYSRDEDGVCSSESTPRGNYCDAYQDGGSYYREFANTTTKVGSCNASATCEDGIICATDWAYDENITIINTTTLTIDGEGNCSHPTETTGFGAITASITTVEPCEEGAPCGDDYNCSSGWDEGAVCNNVCSAVITQTTTTTYAEPVTEAVASVTYSAADTDAEAESAAEWSEWSGIAGGGAISYDQDRNGTGSFEQREAEYAFIATNLVIGKSYSASVGTEDCNYVVAEAEDCVEGTPISVAFSANDIFKVIGGTLSSSVSRNDFVENDYSIDAATYGLPAGEDVINSLTSFAVGFGEKRKMAIGLQLDMD